MTAPTPEKAPLVPYWFPLLLTFMAGGGFGQALMGHSVSLGIVALGLGGVAYFLQTKIT